jgi:hypothetical protein
VWDSFKGFLALRFVEMCDSMVNKVHNCAYLGSLGILTINMVSNCYVVMPQESCSLRQSKRALL